METVTLKNGATEAKALVAITMRSATELLDSSPIAFYELVMVCRDRAHKPFGNTRDTLSASGLWAEHESYPHDSIRNVILSAVTGEGLDMALGSPV